MTHPLTKFAAAPLWSWILFALPVQATEVPADAVRLTGAEIRRAFSDVRDEAQVQNDAGTTAVNEWYADGRFINRWSNGDFSGEVTGQWRAHQDMRCITILSGLPQREGVESCNPVYRQGDAYFSIEPDGKVHGIHLLSPLQD